MWIKRSQLGEVGGVEFVERSMDLCQDLGDVGLRLGRQQAMPDQPVQGDRDACCLVVLSNMNSDNRLRIADVLLTVEKTFFSTVSILTVMYLNSFLLFCLLIIFSLFRKSYYTV